MILNKMESDWENVYGGVPQGSIKPLTVINVKSRNTIIYLGKNLILDYPRALTKLISL